MSFSSFLYTLIIYPIKLILECFYTLFSRFIEGDNGGGYCIIGLSFVVTLLTLPLYIVAEKWAEKERKTQDKLAYRLGKIRETFSGDERYMMQSTYYRENNYHPLMALRSSFTVLIQVPFFIAAYTFLSHLGSLNGVPFLFIKNLAAPDQAIKIGSISINVLPIAMTLINCISGYVYSKGHRLGEKLQIYGCALFFLIILYNSPAGLVVYWTMNNILSLLKNIFYKIKNPKKVLYIIACLIAVLFLVCDLFLFSDKRIRLRIGLALIAFFIPICPFFMKALKNILAKNFKILETDSKLRFSLFILSATILALLAGFMIPSTLMESEPQNFCYIEGYASPFVFLRAPLFQSIGFFLFWPICIYALFSKTVKKNMTVFFSFAALIAMVNCFAFSGDYGPIDSTLRFMQATIEDKLTTPTITLANLLVCLVVLIIFVIVLTRNVKVLLSLNVAFVVSLGFLSARNCISIHKSFVNMEIPSAKYEINPVYHLSREGKNVLVIMQDMLVTSMIPEILEDRPDLIDRFDGFTYYPNTVSGGKLTIVGTPGLFGGYDYVPYISNQDRKKTLQQKHNEAILTMPILFNEAGWATTVSDLPYENYYDEPRTKMYETYPFVNRVTCMGTYSDLWCDRNNFPKSKAVSSKCMRNFFMFSIFKMVNPFLRRIVYSKEYWLAYNEFMDWSVFLNQYSELDFLDELFDDGSEKNSYILLDNELSHIDWFYLQTPDYVPALKVTEDAKKRNGFYHSRFAAMLRWAEFFDYLKEQDLYDNTRIILVSDHGSKNWKSPLYKQPCKIDLNIQNACAALFVKDFNSRGQLKTDWTFMTNADTPYLATEGIIEKAKNPFTGNPLKVENKFESFTVMDAPNISGVRNKDHTKYEYYKYYKVTDNIYDENNWHEVEEADK